MRCFIAIELDEQIKHQLTVAQDLFRQLDGKISWVKPEQMHLTIKFLGSLPESKIADISEAMKTAISKTHIKPFEFTIEGLGAFPQRGAPRVLWAGVTLTKKKKKLHKSIDAELSLLEIPPDEREFTPHLTLARIRNKISPQACRNIIENNAGFIAGVQRVEHVILFASELKPTGAVYTPLAKANLTA